MTITLQRDFTTALLEPDARLPAGLVTPDGRPATKRFNVYRNNVVVSLIDALGAAYPVVKKLVGDEFFDAMAGVYVRAHPPKTPLMILYGEDFPSFLAHFDPAKSVAYLPDVARLERARRECWHAADDPLADPSILADLAAEKLMDVRFVLHASVRLVASAYPIASIWQANFAEEPTPLPKEGQEVLVARPKMEMVMNILPKGGFAFLDAIHKGKTLGEAAESAATADEAFDLSDNLAGVFQTKIASRIKID